jgi:hypothetical protein
MLNDFDSAARERRERIATAVMRGVVLAVDDDGRYWRPAAAARRAVEYADALIAELDKRAGQEPPSAKPAPEPQCTGYAASSCPRCGDCTCARRENGDRIEDSSDNCPLHDDSSKHAEADEHEPTPDALAAAEARGYARCQADVVARQLECRILYADSLASDVEAGKHSGAAARAAERAAKDGPL